MGNYLGQATIDLDALRYNYRLLASKTTATTGVIVKANAYGHGLVECARALNAPLSGVAQLGEALALREKYDGRILTWIWAPGQDIGEAIEADLDISIGAFWQIDALEAAIARLEKRPRIHVEVDTGMARGGFSPADVPEAARRIEALGAKIDPVGVWSHLARADEPDSGETERATALFTDLTRYFPQMKVRHLAATGGLLWHPKAHFDMVRAGIGVYGLSPASHVQTAEQIGLRPVMTLTAPLIAVRTIPADTGISYGHLYRSGEEMTVGTVPLGYADGLPRTITNACEVELNGVRCRVLGRACMDQFVIAVPPGSQPGDIVTLFGNGGPSADTFAEQAGTIGYEITTQLAPRLPRTYLGA